MAEQSIRAAEQSVRAAALTNLATVTTSYGALCENTVIDERACLMFKDNYLNLGMMTKAPSGREARMITDGQPTTNTPISLSMVAVELGLKLQSGELISAGLELSKRFVALHGKPPSKHDQLCGGRMTKVNTYMECDRGLMEEVLLSRTR